LEAIANKPVRISSETKRKASGVAKASRKRVEATSIEIESERWLTFDEIVGALSLYPTLIP
jgi:hypothetical protein